MACALSSQVYHFLCFNPDAQKVEEQTSNEKDVNNSKGAGELRVVKVIHHACLRIHFLMPDVLIQNVSVIGGASNKLKSQLSMNEKSKDAAGIFFVFV
jgi:arginine exporter protein ArgO